jgi:hypothetical protein
MALSEDDLKQIWDFNRAAEACEAAAGHFRHATELMQQGDTPGAFGEGRSARLLLEPLQPAAHRAPVRAEPGLAERVVAKAKAIAEYLKFLVPALLVLGALLYLVMSGSTGDMSKGYKGMTPEEAARASAYPTKK